jgi:SAM-dependent methyltransferase
VSAPQDAATAADALVSDPARDRGDRLNPRRSSRIYWHLTELRRALERVVSDHVAGRGLARLIDAGCGNQPYRPLFESHVAEYLGCDLPGNPAAQLFFGPDGRIPVPTGSAQIALSSQVLEHVPDPAAYLDELGRVLAPGGLLVLSTHGTWRFHPDPTDYWRWTSQGLAKLLAERGFGIVQQTGVVGPTASAIQLFQDAALRRLPSLLRGSSYLVCQLLMSLADRLTSPATRNRDAGTWLIVARRAP